MTERTEGSAEKNIIIGTAGHIDHGKTTLIAAMTGTNTDRLKEEQERGISIDLGFTGFQLTDTIKAGIVDVPGHEKFVKNMLAGAGGVDLALLVIAADEGIMAQTREHLAILELLQVKYGVVAITKIDLVEEEWLELVIEDCREQLQESFLADSPIVPVSGVTEEGLEELQQTLREEAAKIPGKDRETNAYLPIDRVFTMSGFGTVITGTLVRGSLEKGRTMLIYPGNKETRIRSIQVHNKKREKAYPGERVGVNLAGIEKQEIERGDVLAEPGSLIATSRLDGRLKLLPSSPMVMEHGTRIRFHIGAREVLGRVYMIDKEEILPGEEGLVQFRLEEEVVSRYLENFVVRRYSPMITIGGGRVIENSPPRRRKQDPETVRELEIKEQGTPAERVALTLELADRPLKMEELVEKTNLSRVELEGVLDELIARDEVEELSRYQKPSWIAAEVWQKVARQSSSILEEFHRNYPLRPGISREELRSRLEVELASTEFNQIMEDLAAAGKLVEREKFLALPDFEVDFSGKSGRFRKNILELYRENLFAPPELSELDSRLAEKLEEFSGNEEESRLVQEVVLALEREGELIRITRDIYFTAGAYERAVGLVRDFLEEQGVMELSDFRDLLGSSRKYALPLLEHFDEKGITRREGDKRYPGD